MPIVRPSRRLVAWCAALSLVLAAVLPAVAQRPDAESSARPTNPLAALQDGALPGPMPLEGAVDPAAYTVGPGDVFSVYIGGSQPVTFRQVVSADGRLVLPEVPGLVVDGAPLAEVQRRAVEALRTRFRNVTLDVSLIEPRRFYVHVAGAVPTSGRFVATPVSRVSTVLRQAFADSVAAVGNPDFRPSLRNVTVRHRDGTVGRYDLRRYFAAGDTRHDPFLRDGDVVTVPAYDPRREAVFVDGAVAEPGPYAFRPGDTVADLLVLATGEETPPPLSVRISRRGAETDRVIELTTAEVAARADEITVEPLDHLFVGPVDMRDAVAAVEGAVRFPGTYPIVAGTTRLAELVEAAGGLLPDALVRGAYLERRVLREADALPSAEGADRPALRGAADRLPFADEVDRHMRLAGFDYLTRAYVGGELRLQNRVSLDLAALLDGGDDEVVLRDGDRLVVPEDEGTVFVFGEVNRPGYLPHTAGRDAADYVVAAGGRSPLAAEAYVIKAGTRQYVPAGRATVESGDMVFINRDAVLADTPELQRLVMEQERERSDRRFRTIQTALSIVGTAATAITTYLLITRDN